MMRLQKLTFWQAVFIMLMVALAYVTFIRFYYGLGASTNLTDQFPWGIWIGFDILCGVGLAAGGFTLAATVHIFNIKTLQADCSAGDSHGLSWLRSGRLCSHVRPWAAVPHLASPHHVEPSLRHVRGRLVRHAVHHGAGSRIRSRCVGAF